MIGVGKKDARTKPITAEEEKAMWEDYARTKSPKIRDRFINSVLGLCVNEASKVTRGNSTHEDLVQAGMLGAVMAFDRFDPNKGVRFNTYAVFWIRERMWELARNERTIVSKAGLTGRRADKQKGEVKITYLGEGDGIRSEPFGERTGGRVLTDNLRVVPAMQQLAHPNLVIESTVESDLILTDEQRQIRKALERSRLTQNERTVVEKRFLSGEEISLREIGEQLRLSRERVRQIEMNALRKLKRTLARMDEDEDEMMLPETAAASEALYGREN